MKNLIYLFLILLQACEKEHFRVENGGITDNTNVTATTYERCVSGDIFSGAGTAVSPYLVGNKLQLNCIRYHMDAHFKLTANIDLENEAFDPLGGSLFDGARFSSIARVDNVVTVTTVRIHGIEKDSKVIVQGATDASFNVNREKVLEADDYSFSYANAGPDATTAFGSARVSNPFLGVIDGNGFEIRNLVINKTGSQNVGFVSAMGYGADIKNLTFRDVSVTHNLTGTGIVAGCMFCFVVGDNALARPIVQNVNVINATVAGGYLTGGISGYATGYSRVENVRLESLLLSGASQTGGVVGSGWGTVLISNVRVEGDLSANGASLGGILGFGACANIDKGSFVGTLTSTTNSVGGITGYFENRYCGGTTGHIRDSYAHATIDAAGAQMGGIIGISRYGAQVTRSYSFSTVNTALASKGGCVGHQDNGAVVNSCYYNDTVHVDVVPKAGETALTPAQMIDPATNMTILTAGNPGVWDFVNGFLPELID